jgi:pimeloyl-ACP methyl ester carboxylesterase
MPRKHGWPARTAAAILLAVAIAAALCGGILLPYFLAGWLANIPVLVFVSILSCFLILWVGGRISSRLWGALRGARFATQVAGVLTLVFAVSLYWLILKPTADPGPPHPLENIRYWQLPTGSRIAYREIDPPEGTSVKPHPVIYLHGGAGAREGHFDQSIYGSLASEGFRVFLYDQAGSGMSDFLKVREYTIVRAAEDLEAIRQEIGADQMILVGHSWGARLAVKYMSTYPGHVAKVILHSPASIWRWTPMDFDYRRTDVHEEPFPKLRFLAALSLVERNPDAAQNLVSQREAEGLLIPILDWEIHDTVCKGDSDRFPKDFTDFQAAHDNPGMNPYVMQHLALEPKSPDADPHEALRKDHTPAILLYSQCDFIDWSAALDYRKTMPNLKTYYIPHAGHYIQFEQPELMRRIMAAFLLDQPDVITPVDSDVDPRLKPSAPGR